MNKYKLWELSGYVCPEAVWCYYINSLFSFSKKYFKVHCRFLMDKSGIIGPKFNILGLWFLNFRKITFFPSPFPEILIHHFCNLLFTSPPRWSRCRCSRTIVWKPLNWELQVVASGCGASWRYLCSSTQISIHYLRFKIDLKSIIILKRYNLCSNCMYYVSIKI